MTGKFGVGGNSTLGGASGLNVMIGASKLLILDVTAGMSFTAPAATGADNVTALRGAVHGFLNLADYDNANLLVGLGVNVMTNSTLDNALGMAVDIPIRPVYFFSDHFSIMGEVGLTVDFMQQGNDPPTGSFESDLSIDLVTSLLGGFGFTYWF